MALNLQTTYSESPAIGFPGQLADNGPYDAITMINKEASATMVFGRAVNFEGSTRDKGALNPDATTDKIAGVVLRSLAYAPDTLVDDGVPAGGTVSVARKGRIYVLCENGCVPGDRLHVRVLGGTEGALRSAADGVNTIDSTGQGVWLSTAAAGAIAVLEVDFTNKAA